MAAYQARIPDVWLGEDGNLRILLEIESGQIEGLFIANQILLEDMFIQSANYASLQRHGEEFSLPMKLGTPATGQLLFTGQGGTDVPIGTEVAYDPGSGADVLYFVTTQDGIIPNPGTPTAVTAAVGAAGNLTGTYEYVITFITAQGESLAGPDSNAVVLSAQQTVLTNIPLGGPGTIARNLYRSKNGGAYGFVTQIANNTTVTINDNLVDGSVTIQKPPTISTAEKILVNAESEENGLDFNAVAGAITVLSATPDGVTAVTNPAPFIGGTSEESLDDYRTRLLTFIRSPVTGAIADIITWALAVPGVDSVTVFPNDNMGVATPGHVTVRVAGPNGAIPSSSVLDAVAAALVLVDLATITIHVTAFTQTPLAVAVTITVQSGYVLADLVTNIQNAIIAYINNVPVGGTVYLTGIISAVMAVTGVADVAVTAPASNQTAAATSKFTPGTITVS